VSRPAEAEVDSWDAGKAVLRAADPRMGALVDADPSLILTALSTAGRVTSGVRWCSR
jgi:hypothetical protein